MKVNLVKFSNGKWGVRKGGLWNRNYQYFDFISYGLWWGKDSRFFCDCMTDEERARMVFSQIIIKDKVKG